MDLELDQVWNDLESFFENAALQILLIILLILIAHKLVGFIIQRVVRRAMHFERFATHEERRKRQDTVIAVFRGAANITIWIVGIIFILMALDVNVPALLTGAGLIGIVVGFGTQNTIKDVLAGIFILTEAQYRVGDIVTLYVAGKEISGVVEDFTLRVTRIRDLDGNLNIVQNGAVTTVINKTFKYANVNLDVSVSYDTDVDKVEAVINKVGDALAADEKWKKHIFEPIHFLRIDEFDSSTVRIKALGRVEPAKQWEIAGEFRRRLKKEFEKNKIVVSSK